MHHKVMYSSIICGMLIAKKMENKGNIFRTKVTRKGMALLKISNDILFS